MPRLIHRYYYKQDELPFKEQVIYQAFSKITGHKLFNYLEGEIYLKPNRDYGKNGLAVVDKSGRIYLNSSILCSADEWAYVIVHCLLHLAFGHFDDDKIPKGDHAFDPCLWNMACDIYITRFLYDIAFETPVCADPADFYSVKLNDEKKIYEYLLKSAATKDNHPFGTNGNAFDMLGIEHPIIYKTGETNLYTESFSLALNHSVSNAVHYAGGHTVEKKNTVITKAANWFLTHYPLLGSLAATFKIIENLDLCYKYEIHIAAVNISEGEIYINPAAKLDEEEWIFVLAHEFLHAGLQHHKRCLGRDKYLWNVACDYVVNDWLHDMKIGKMPEDGLLYDKSLHGYSAEAIYDIIIKQMRMYKKLFTFRGYGHGDIMNDGIRGFAADMTSKGISLDEFFKNALAEGLDFHTSSNRGYLPAGLVAEIRALSTPPIPWEVELGRWFDEQFPPLQKHQSYARPSRRQNATPDIPRPRYTLLEDDLESRTFGVIVDTSGSMSATQIGLALGAIASYANAKDVPFVRVVFCDADAYDAGYMTPEDIAGKVKVTGGGGTILQSAVTFLENTKDFPKNGPILIITDGYIEEKINIHREHAFLLPKGCRLPFTPKGKLFYFK